MEHYVTLLDNLFLPQALALHDSLETCGDNYTLWVLCLDDETHRLLTALNPPNVQLLALAQIQTTELLRVKEERSKREYCWTVTPFAPRFVFESDSSVKRVTYVDADLWFLRSAEPIFREFETAEKHVLITDHAYAPEYDQSAISGKYCVQFLIFRRDGGEGVRKWWEERCIEWCFDRVENGKFGDQKYLDEWPVRFGDKVQVLQNQAWALAPWNASRFPYSGGIFYHFHGLRLLDNKRVNLGEYPLPPVLVGQVYKPYVAKLKNILTMLRAVGWEAPPQQVGIGFDRKIRSLLHGIRSQMWRFNSNQVLSY